MKPERQSRVEQLVQEALELEENERGEFLERHCAGDQSLRGEVESLLAFEKDADRFMEASAVQVAAEALAKESCLTQNSQVAQDDALEGQTISHYRILSKLGSGGMGVVYKAEDLKLGRQVAIKLLPGEMSSDPKAFEQLEREARAASALDHRSICSVYELGEYEGQPFIVMQFLEGRTIREWTEGKDPPSAPPQLRELLDVGVQIADGLEAAHQKGIIHRDIKPANILLTNRGEVKILDFGVAKFLENRDSPQLLAVAVQDGTQPATLTVTRTGAAVGTPSYLSPEQIRGEKLDARTDVFSFGLVLYEMATGQRAFAGDTVTEICQAVLNQPAVPARELNPELPTKMESIIAKALEKDRDHRFQSAVELRTALEQLRSGLEGATRPSGSRIWVTAGAAGVLLLAAVLYLADVRQRLWRTASNAAASVEIRPRRSVAVLGFKNLTGNPQKDWISTALAEMVSTELAAGRQLRTIPGESVAGMKLDLSLAVADSYGRETLSKISNNLSADLVVVGSYLAVGEDSGGKIRVDLRLQDTHAGETVAAISQDGTEGDLGELVSRAGTNLRQTLGIALVTSTEAREVRASFPTTAEASRLYAEGLAKLRDFDAVGARDLLEKAVAADPRHALSHSALAEAWSVLGYDAKAQEESKKAFDLSAGLSREERLSVEGRYRELSHDFASAIEIYRTLSNFFPDELDYGLRLASSQTRGSAGKDALQTVARMRTQTKPATDDPRIDLGEEAAAESQGDFRHAQQAATAAVAKAQAKGNRLLMAEATQREAWMWDRLGDLDRAAKEATQAHDLATGAGNPRLSGRALRGVGHVLYDQGDFAAANKAFEEALHIFQKVGAQLQVGNTLTDIGNVYYDQGKMEEARQYYEAALRVDREIANGFGIASNLGSLANVMDAMGSLTEATRMQEQSLQAFRETGDKRGESSTLDNLGKVLLERGELTAAKLYFDQALALSDQIGFKRGRGFVLVSLADLLLAQDRLNEAQHASEQSLDLRQKLKDELNLARSQTQLAEISVEQGKPAEAESLARTAAAAFDAQKETDGDTLAQAVLTRALLAQGNKTEALVAGNRALTLSHQTTDRASRFSAVLAAAEVDAQSGARVQARRAFENVLTEASHYGYAGFELESRLHLGELEVRSGEVVSGRARLRDVRDLAKQKGFLLIARKAAATLGHPANPVRPN